MIIVERRLLLFSLLLLSSDLLTLRALEKTSVVTTKYGRIQGFVTRFEGHRVSAYLGVPYARPPTGKNRFSPTGTLRKWIGVRDTAEFAPACPQRLPEVANTTEALKRMSKARLSELRRTLPALKKQAEDCLYLNVYAPGTGNL